MTGEQYLKELADEKTLQKEEINYSSKLVHSQYDKPDCQSYYVLANYYIRTNRALLALKTFYKIKGNGVYSHKYRVKLLHFRKHSLQSIF